MIWWGWIVIGLLLLGAELFVVEADFFLVFLGVSAILTGLLGFTLPGIPGWAEWTFFALIALSSMVFFRKRVYRALRRDVPDMANDMLGQQLNLPVALPVAGSCRVEYRGSTWTARNDGIAEIPLGRRARVIGVDGIILRVESES
jgi:hypothetical protein